MEQISHKHHYLKLPIDGNCTCGFCGVRLCCSLSEGGTCGCNLEAGHKDDCMNTYTKKVWPNFQKKAA
jgi:hypothetical protein